MMIPVLDGVAWSFLEISGVAVGAPDKRVDQQDFSRHAGTMGQGRWTDVDRRHDLLALPRRAGGAAALP